MEVTTRSLPATSRWFVRSTGGLQEFDQPPLRVGGKVAQLLLVTRAKWFGDFGQQLLPAGREGDKNLTAVFRWAGAKDAAPFFEFVEHPRDIGSAGNKSLGQDEGGD